MVALDQIELTGEIRQQLMQRLYSDADRAQKAATSEVDPTENKRYPFEFTMEIIALPQHDLSDASTSKLNSSQCQRVPNDRNKRRRA